jgi:hypothetical protein
VSNLSFLTTGEWESRERRKRVVSGLAGRKRGSRGSRQAESDLAVGHDEDLGGSCSGLGIPGERDRLLHAGDRELESFASLPNRRSTRCCRASGAPTTSEGSRQASVTLTTDNGTQLTTSRFVETLNRLSITHRRTAYHHPEGNNYIERFHRSLKEEEAWTRVAKLGGSAGLDRSLDRGVQSRPASSWRRKSHSARSLLGFR